MWWPFKRNKNKTKPETKPETPTKYQTPFDFQLTLLIVETANRVKYNINHISLLIIDKGKYEYKFYYVKPPTKAKSYTYESKNGISTSDCENAQPFPIVLEQIRPYIENKNIGVFYGNFHLTCLDEVCKYYDLELPHFNYVLDLFEISLTQFPKLESHSMDSIADKIDSSFDPTDFQSKLDFMYDYLDYIDLNRPKLLKKLYSITAKNEAHSLEDEID